MSRMHKNKSGYKVYSNTGKLVHRHVAERKLGGSIWDGYEVHHKNGNKTDNRRRNLQVVRKDIHKKIHSQKKKSFNWW